MSQAPKWARRTKRLRRAVAGLYDFLYGKRQSVFIVSYRLHNYCSVIKEGHRFGGKEENR